MYEFYRPSWVSVAFVLILMTNSLFAQEAETPDSPTPESTPSAEEAPPTSAPEEPAAEPPAETPPEPPAETPPAEEPAAGPLSLSEPVVPTPAPATPLATAPAKPIAPAATPATAPVEPLPVEETESPAVADEPAEESSAVSTIVPQEPTAMEEPVDDEPNGFAKLSLSPQIGFAYFPASSYEFDGYKLNVDRRNSFVAKIHLDLGGDGIAFELAPLIAAETIGGDYKSIGADLGDGVSGSFFAVGGEMNLVYRASWGSFYPHLGIGFHGASLSGDNIEYGAELYGRIPLGFTWYMAKRFALVVEFAFMYGVTGIKGPTPSMGDIYDQLADRGISEEQVESIDWTRVSTEDPAADLNEQLGLDPEDSSIALDDEEVKGMIQEQISSAIKFGKGYAFELMVGIRFP